jgi:2-polyprenyl-3-methyl-5-hydroxy-6-metoxy-1,4-benzoquinol methylase
MPRSARPNPIRRAVRRRATGSAHASIMSVDEYGYESAEPTWSDDYVVPHILRGLAAEPFIRRVLEAGCGNGRLSARLAAKGFEVTAFDTSRSGVSHAQLAFPELRFEVASAYDDLRERFGMAFDACVCVEVIEHLYDPRTFARRIFEVLRPQGLFILSTPYHGYLKNLALAITGRMDSHFTALWDGGHIKFWSRATLTTLLCEQGFEVINVTGVGRAPFLWKSMVVTARKRS